MPDQNTATRPKIPALWDAALAADAVHKAALDDLARLMATGQWVSQAIAKVQEAHAAKMRAVAAWMNACNEDDSEESAEERVRAAREVIAERQYEKPSPMDLAWDLEDAGLLGSVRG